MKPIPLFHFLDKITQEYNINFNANTPHIITYMQDLSSSILMYIRIADKG